MKCYICKEQTMYMPYSPLTEMYHNKILEIVKSITDEYVMRINTSGSYIIFKDETVFHMVSTILPMYDVNVVR